MQRKKKISILFLLIPLFMSNEVFTEQAWGNTFTNAKPYYPEGFGSDPSSEGMPYEMGKGAGEMLGNMFYLSRNALWRFYKAASPRFGTATESGARFSKKLILGAGEWLYSRLTEISSCGLNTMTATLHFERGFRDSSTGQFLGSVKDTTLKTLIAGAGLYALWQLSAKIPLGYVLGSPIQQPRSFDGSALALKEHMKLFSKEMYRPLDTFILNTKVKIDRHKPVGSLIIETTPHDGQLIAEYVAKQSGLPLVILSKESLKDASSNVLRQEMEVAGNLAPLVIFVPNIDTLRDAKIGYLKAAGKQNVVIVGSATRLDASNSNLIAGGNTTVIGMSS